VCRILECDVADKERDRKKKRKKVMRQERQRNVGECVKNTRT
jgi:hypothetical protein